MDPTKDILQEKWLAVKDQCPKNGTNSPPRIWPG